MRSLDDITRDLATVAAELLDVPRDDFATRHALQTRQDELRREAERFRTDFDEQRPMQDVLAELAEARRQRDLAVADNAARVTASGPGGGSGGVSAASGYAMTKLSIEAKASSRISALNARIAHLEAIVAARGVRPADAPLRAGEAVRRSEPSGA